MTPQRAELEGVDVDFGPNCDTETGRIKLISVYAPPCVEPFEGDNGGATYPGVTADEILIVDYNADPALDPLWRRAGGADVNPETAQAVLQDFVDLYNELYETYGLRSGSRPSPAPVRAPTRPRPSRRHRHLRDGAVRRDRRPGPGPGRVLGHPGRGRHHLRPGCADTLPEDAIEEYEPYLWPTGPTPNQAVALAAEMVGNLAGPGPAEIGGHPEMQAEERVYGLLHYDNADGDHVPVMEAFREELAANDIEIAADVEFTLDLARRRGTPAPTSASSWTPA